MLIELRYYSPTNFHIWHYGLIEADSYGAATDKLRWAGKLLRVGSEPISFKQVVNADTHDWGKGFSKAAGDMNRRVV